MFGSAVCQYRHSLTLLHDRIQPSGGYLQSRVVCDSVESCALQICNGEHYEGSLNNPEFYSVCRSATIRIKTISQGHFLDSLSALWLVGEVWRTCFLRVLWVTVVSRKLTLTVSRSYRQFHPVALLQTSSGAKSIERLFRVFVARMRGTEPDKRFGRRPKIDDSVP